MKTKIVNYKFYGFKGFISWMVFTVLPTTLILTFGTNLEISYHHFYDVGDHPASGWHWIAFLATSIQLTAIGFYSWRTSGKTV